jgi:putative transposase
MHPPRIRAFSYAGLYQYFLTLCTDIRRPVFASECTVLPALEQFRQSALHHGFAVLAYCFMPDHLHLLCEARTESSDLVAFVHEATQRTGYSFTRSNGTRLWQRGFYDHVLRVEERVLAVVQYIVTNPIRAGLAQRLGEYPFCGSDVFSIEEIRACPDMWEPDRTAATRR